MGLARSQNYLFVKVGTCPLFAHSQMRLGLATSSADIVANGRYRRMARFRQFPRPWGRMNAGRGQAPMKGSRSREKVIVEVVTLIAMRDNVFGRLSSLRRPLRGGSR